MDNILKNKFIFLSSLIGFFGFFIQMYFTVNRKLEEGFSLFYSLNHFLSYFTIIINLTLSLLLYFYSVHPELSISRWFKKSAVNGAVCLYILIVGLIFYGLLFKDSKAQGIEALASHLLHAFTPLAYVYFWYFNFRDSSLKYTDSLRWLSVPFLYFVYLMIRGQIVGKYPYFFVDVERFGIATIALFAVAILSFFVLVGCLLIYIDRRQPARTK
ncbi:MAG: hypothetical protein K0R29_1765 [Pseudobdellovibrio sp.]|jgi:hypothetical protein|nr:hypothetical protein [Pseudobdellovibrio sp.]